MGDAGAPLGIAQQIVQPPNLVRRSDLRRHDRRKTFGDRCLEFGRRALEQRLDADEGADARRAHFMYLAL